MIPAGVDVAVTKPFKIETRLDTYDDATGVLLRTETSEQWYEPDGTEIHDPARIDELEARQAAHIEEWRQRNGEE